METIKIDRVFAPYFFPVVLDERKYELPSPVAFQLHTNRDGMIIVELEAGFTCDGRSGGPLADLVLPNVGDQLYRRCPWVHDALFAHAASCVVKSEDPAISFETANDIFYQMLRLPRIDGGAGFGRIRAGIAYGAVSTSFGERAYSDVDSTDYANMGKVKLSWVSRRGYAYRGV